MILRAIVSALVLAAAIASSGRSAAQVPTVSKVENGIVAALSVDQQQANVGWRFLTALQTPIEDITAAMNGRPLGTPVIEPYPAPGQSTAVVALLDLGDRARADQIERSKVAMLMLTARKSAHDQIGFAVYGLVGNMLVPPANTPAALIDMLLAVPPLDEGSNLTGALIHSIRTLERIEANRRAVYVFTDGHNDSEIPLTAVVEPAIAAGVSLTFLVIPSARSADLAVIQNVATATGGQFVSESVLVDFLRAPFAILDSGARASFPLANVRRFFWELESQIEVKFRYGTNELVLQAPASLPVAGAGETTEYLLQNHPLVLAGSGAALLAVTFGGAFLVLRRRRPDGSGEIPSQDAAAEVPARPVFATLQNIADGTVYPLQGAVVAIGRDGANEIVLNDKSVTRRHAALVQGGFGGYTIEDQGSANGTFVNHERIQKKELAEGDLITVGSTTLLFTKLIETEADATPKADLA